MCGFHVFAVPVQGIVDDALKKVTAQNHSVKTVLVYDHKLAAQRESVPFVEGRDVWWQDAVAEHSTQCDIEWMGAEDPLFKVRKLHLRTTRHATLSHLHASQS